VANQDLDRDSGIPENPRQELPSSSVPSTPFPSPQYVMRPPKDRGIAMVLEIVGGLFGLFGIGWIYSGNTAVGVMLLAGGIFWIIIIIIAAAISAAAACFCTVPLSLVVTAVSSFSLFNYTKQHPELFGA